MGTTGFLEIEILFYYQTDFCFRNRNFELLSNGFFAQKLVRGIEIEKSISIWEILSCVPYISASQHLNNGKDPEDGAQTEVAFGWALIWALKL